MVEAELQAQWHPNLDEMLSAIDILTIHTPRNPDSEGLIDAGRIALLRPHVYVINTSRGGIVDEGALIVARPIRCWKAGPERSLLIPAGTSHDLVGARSGGLKRY